VCGIVGVYRFDGKDTRDLLFRALYSLQHRGQEAAGFVVSDGKRLVGFKDLGSVARVFERAPATPEDARIGVAHTRYSTAGGSRAWHNAQPIWVYHNGRPLVIAHNGHLARSSGIRQQLEREGEIFFTTSDTEVLLHLFTRPPEGDLPRRWARVTEEIPAAFSVVLQYGENLMAVRDPFGFRPLVMAEYPDFVLFASETAAFHLLGKPMRWREVEPGEVVWVNGDGVHRARYTDPKNPAPCVFELIYFSRPDSEFVHTPVYRFRVRTGELLAEGETEHVDLVIPVPDSGVAAALGYARALGVPLEFGLVRSHYVGRTFIRPAQSERLSSVRLKLIPVGTLLKGKSVAVVDDSIVRGTTSGRIVSLLREYGVREVHFRVAAPPIQAPCHFGIDIPTHEELIAYQRNPREVAQGIGADTVRYLSVDDLYRAAGQHHFCVGCFTGVYPEGSL
jgi:amidophosphoribosyltransferase